MVGFILLLLASASMARRRLLEQAGIPFDVMVSDVDEKNINHSDPIRLVQILAEAKAESVLKKLISEKFNRDYLPIEVSSVLGCDSLFEFQGQVFGKPKDSKEASERLQLMSSASGKLHTGHSILFLRSSIDNSGRLKVIKKLNQVISTHVYFGSLTQSEIDSYVATGEPLRCAGGFTLEGLGGKFVSRLDGCYSNVIGLSLPWLRTVLLDNILE